MESFKEKIPARALNRCPICGMELVRLRYMGFDFDKIMREFWIREFEDDAFESSGNPIWVEAVSGRYG